MIVWSEIRQDPVLSHLTLVTLNRLPHGLPILVGGGGEPDHSGHDTADRTRSTLNE